MRIGELAHRAEVGVDTVRYYERQGLLPPPARLASGYRRYDQSDVERLRFVRRAKALGFWTMQRRQICWAHLLRKFVSFAERDGPAGAIGRELLDLTAILFEYWHDYKAGKLARDRFVLWVAALGERFEATLQRAVDADIARLSGSCADILAHKEALWTFAKRDDVEPTNNHAEREIRAFVLWRKRSFGTQSERGNLFAERLMSVAHTARKQKKNVLAFLTSCCVAQGEMSPAPSLFAAA